MLKTLQQPPPRLTPDYDHSVLKSAEAKEQRLKSSSASGKSVAQLRQQKNESCPPLKVYSNTDVRSSRGAFEQYDPQYDPEFVAMYGEAATAHGMSIPEYLDHVNEFHEVAYKYRHGSPLVKPELVNGLPTKMLRLHNWYMRASQEGGNWIYLVYNNDHYGHGDGVVMIEFDELFQLYQQDTIDKAIASVYCLMKILECKRGRINDIGFIDPYFIHETTLKTKPVETESNLVQALRFNDTKREILFPYKFDFHFILLIIVPDEGVVEVMDSKRKPLKKWADMQECLQRA